MTSNALLELTAEQAARALDLQEDCRQLPRWASRTIVRLQDRVAELERAALEPSLEHRCGVQGFNSMKGDVCPACSTVNRKA